MKKMSKIMSCAMAVLMLFGSVGHVAAANYTPVAGGTTELDKYLVIPADAEIPEAEFSFSIAAGQAAEATGSTVKVWAGLNPELVKLGDAAGESDGKVAFTAGESATTALGQAALGEDYVDEKAAMHELLVDFSSVNFPEPGVYRYLVTEGAQSNGAITNDAQPIRTIDVYVEDDGNGTLVVTDYVAYLGDMGTTAPDNAIDMSAWLADNPAPVAPTVADPANPTPEEEAALAQYETAKATWEAAKDAEEARLLALVPNGAEAGAKSDKYVNSLESHNLQFGKEVEGNQGSKDQYFAFTLTINGAGAGTVMSLDMSQAELAPLENAATSYSAADMAEANAVDDDDTKDGQQLVANASGSVTKTFYLKDGQYIKVKGLPEGASYVVEESAAGYTKSEGTSKVGRAAVEGSEAVLYTAEDQEVIDGIKQVGDVKTPAVEAIPEKLHSDPTSGTMAHEDIFTGWTNTREGVIPTGVMMSVAGGVGLLALAGVGIVLTRKKEEE